MLEILVDVNMTRVAEIEEMLEMGENKISDRLIRSPSSRSSSSSLIINAISHLAGHQYTPTQLWF